ncbi:MAG: glycosyltransferase family 4 protein [Candidatus Binataceae bacterium]
MRIAIANTHARIIGGVETYLDCVLPALARAGDEVALLYESDMPDSRPHITLPEGAPAWRLSAADAGQTFAALRRWRPDLVYVHGLDDGGLEAVLIEHAPSIFFAHAYHGTCVGSQKTFKFPVARPCSRRFGWPCLAFYYPRRCGGLNPFTMATAYARQSARLALLGKYRAIVTASAHMRAEYVRHGFARVHCVGLPVTGHVDSAVAAADSPVGDDSVAAITPARPWRLLFAGRMMPLKGGATLLGAMPEVIAALDRPVHLTFAGDGPARHVWEAKARETAARCRSLEITFTGWASGDQMAALFGASDLIVMPSLWPEPFGLSGPEAGLYGVPAVAFAGGGIPEWLIDDVNGCLAAADPPTAHALAGAIVRCLRDPEAYLRLRRGAREMAQRLNLNGHLESLTAVFAQVTNNIGYTGP